MAGDRRLQAGEGEVERGIARAGQAAWERDAAGSPSRATRIASLDAPAVEAINEAAEAIDAATIVLGSRGRGGIQAAMLGSTSTAVPHRSGPPTLVVPPAGAERGNRGASPAN
jgi:nucleotide-binding universal stress UspA family protein